MQSAQSKQGAGSNLPGLVDNWAKHKTQIFFLRGSGFD